MLSIYTHAVLQKSSAGFIAVRNIDLEIPRGTIFGFLGPNGAGKSTTVKMLTGLLRPTSGDALIAGHSVITQPTEVKRGIGVLPEDMALFQYLTIWEHLMMADLSIDSARWRLNCVLSNYSNILTYGKRDIRT